MLFVVLPGRRIRHATEALRFDQILRYSIRERGRESAGIPPNFGPIPFGEFAGIQLSLTEYFCITIAD